MKSKIKIIAVVVVILLLLKFWSKKNMKYQILKDQELRSDKMGSGHYGASRGSRKHKGVDLIAIENESVFAPIDGIITHSQPYAGDTKYRGVRVTNGDQEWKVFYCLPSFPEGTKVFKGQKIAKAQDISEKYGNGMINHVHVEYRIKNKLQNPEKYLL